MLSLASLFTGGGGLDWGLGAAGFETRVAVEKDSDCCRTLQRNSWWPVLEADIHTVSTERLLAEAGCVRGDLDLVAGGPPCQPFSKSSYWRGDTKRLLDPRASTLGAFLRVVEEALPRVFLLENVEGLAYAGKSEGLQMVLDAVVSINQRTGSRYAPTYQVLAAENYGVPQRRRRLFLVAARDGRRFSFPEPLGVSRTAWDAIGDLTPDPTEDLRPRGRYGCVLPSIPEGRNYLWHTERGGGLPLWGWRKRYWSFLLKLAKDQPSWTIQAQPGPAVGPFHWHSRLLSVREMCRLQTFPDNVHIVGSRRSAQRQIGNAVPSLLGEILGREIRRQLLDEEIRTEVDAKLCLLPPDRGPAPPAEPVGVVPSHIVEELLGPVAALQEATSRLS